VEVFDALTHKGCVLEPPTAHHSAGNGAINQAQLIAVCKVLGVNRSGRGLTHDTQLNYVRSSTADGGHGSHT
jgi:hypothetical protein